MAEKKFTNGFIFKQKPNAPEFVKMGVAVKADEAIQFIKENASEGWLNFDILESKNGKMYGQVDDWKPNTNKSSETSTEEDGEDLPF